MTQPTATIINFRQIATTLRQHYLLWTIPTVCLTLLSLAYALTASPKWEASQALLVRDEAAGNESRPGRFNDTEAMKTAQETIVEVARNYRVVEEALRQVGPADGQAVTPTWPARLDIEKLRGAIRVSAPKGAELGKTEVIYLYVSAGTRERALQLTDAVCDRMQQRLQELRNGKAESMIAEFEKTVLLAQSGLNEATERLEKMEADVGSDLGELRILNDSGAGDSNLRSALNQIKNELRQARAKHDASQQQLGWLTAAQNDPDQLVVATSSQLLESQPSLKRLKDALVDAQIRRAELGGRLNADHPSLKSAIAAEQLVRDNLHAELEVAIRGLQADLKVSGALVASLDQQSDEVAARLNRLAQLRARYGNLVADVRQRSAILEKAQKELSDAQASRAAAHSASLLTRLDAPQAGNSPVGPGKTTIVAGGLLGGLLTGFGLVLLLAPIGSQNGKRWSDQLLNIGRRATDRIMRRRATDATTARRADDHDRSIIAVAATSTAVAQSAQSIGRRGEDHVSPAPADVQSSADRRANRDRRISGQPS
jgi:succinoglycan biosynthesis transport protein ExoP